MPEPSTTTMKVTAMAANVPAMAALQENGVLLASSAAGTMTSRSMKVVSVMGRLLRASSLARSRALPWILHRASTILPVLSSVRSACGAVRKSRLGDVRQWNGGVGQRVLMETSGGRYGTQAEASAAGRPGFAA